jgi:hypothetical protein
MTVIATARTRPPGTVEGGVTFVDTPTLLADSDVITVHTPLPPQTNPELRKPSPEQDSNYSNSSSHHPHHQPVVSPKCLVQLKIAWNAPRLLGFAM